MTSDVKRWHLPTLIGGPHHGTAPAAARRPEHRAVCVPEVLEEPVLRGANPPPVDSMRTVEHHYVLMEAGAGARDAVTFYAHSGLQRHEAVSRLLGYLLRRGGAVQR